ncbi:hypothetical protein ACHHYP_01609 [Achlya hypogyna]|uniref:Guanylyl cyclase n=1 Tax=Achlya hypogyna TaxID=1202772 RepID=A0A1V9ZTB9_ACHHY|nr:hypothetical protein ACHHYP_01609 [Achlya hypogyna]
MAKPRQVRQRHDWDCGLACVQTVLDWLGAKADNADSLAVAVGTQSIWTIDLVALLLEEVPPGSRVTFYSHVLEASYHLAHDCFYYREYLTDMKRIQPLFRSVVALGCAHRGSLGLPALRAALREGSLALVLLNASQLSCCVRSERAFGFEGHFIVVFGISSDGVNYVDPASPQHSTCWMTIATFEAARKCSGTDEDIVLISR